MAPNQQRDVGVRVVEGLHKEVLQGEEGFQAKETN